MGSVSFNPMRGQFLAERSRGRQIQPDAIHFGGIFSKKLPEQLSPSLEVENGAMQYLQKFGEKPIIATYSMPSPYGDSYTLTIGDQPFSFSRYSDEIGNCRQTIDRISGEGIDIQFQRDNYAETLLKKPYDDFTLTISDKSKKKAEIKFDAQYKGYMASPAETPLLKTMSNLIARLRYLGSGGRTSSFLGKDKNQVMGPQDSWRTAEGKFVNARTGQTVSV